MITIAFGFVVEQGAAEWSGLTGGWNGRSGISAPALFGIEFSDRVSGARNHRAWRPSFSAN
jgi:ABC-type branched-subunit amino acid transport system permease subunit